MGNIIASLAFKPPNNHEIYKIDSCELHWITTNKYNNIIPTLYYKNPFSRYTLLYSHGNSSTMFEDSTNIIKIAKVLNVSLFMYEYSGYGPSSPVSNYIKTYKDIIDLIENKLFVQSIKPSENTARDDIESAHQYMISKLMIDPKSIILYGFSLGTGISSYLCWKLFTSKSTIIPCGLILHSPYMSIMRVGIDVNTTFFCDIFPTIDIISDIKIPICIIHGLKDEVIPIQHSKNLYLKIDKKYRYDPLYLPQGTHSNSFHSYYSDCINYISDYLFYLHTFNSL